MPELKNRNYDIVVWGATGFTGKLCAEHLARIYSEEEISPGKKLKWALAGRNRAKLEELKSQLELSYPLFAKQGVDLLVGDSNDQNEIDNIVKQSRVIVAFAGPFFTYGKPVVDACVRFGTEYCDITGEPDFFHDSIAAHHSAAKAAGTRLVPCCGFDSVPFDLGAFATSQHLTLQQGGGPAKEVQCYMGDMSGGASGGTLATIVRCLGVNRPGMNDPFYLSPELQQAASGSGGSAGKTPQIMPQYWRDAGSWTSLSVMAAINSKVVYRSAGLLPDVLSPRVVYKESTLTSGALAALLSTCALGLGLAAIALSAPRKLLLTTGLIPSPGQGPSVQARKAGFFNIHFIASSKKTDGPGEVRAEGLFAYPHGDPGYAATSLMALEAAVSLLQTQNEVKRGEGGVLTPSSALGWTLIDRLRKRNFLISVKSAPSEGTALTKSFPSTPWIPPSARSLKSGCGLYPFTTATKFGM